MTKRIWKVKTHPSTGAIWIEDTDGLTVCDLSYRTAHSPTGVQQYMDAEAHAAAIVAKADPTATQGLVEALQGLLAVVQDEYGLNDNGVGADGFKHSEYTTAQEALRRVGVVV